MNTILTKKKIEQIAYVIMFTLKEYSLHNYVRLYFNNKVLEFDRYDCLVTTDDVSPLDYFKYANRHHIISMSFEGSLYDYIYNHYFEFPKELEEIFKLEGIYWELGDRWNCTFYSNGREVEYTDYSDEETFQPSIDIYKPLVSYNPQIPNELAAVAEIWYALGQRLGDKGSCVIGAQMEFKYNNKKYNLIPFTGYQGSLSWETNVTEIKKLLLLLGAEEVTWNSGRLD